MGADISRVRFDPLRRLRGRRAPAGQAAARRRLQRVRRAARPAAARGDVRPHLVRPRPRPRGRRVGAAPDARRRSASRHPAASSRSAAAGCTSTACSPRTTATPPNGFDPLLSRAHRHGRHAVRQAAVLADAGPAAGRRAAPRLPRRLAARGHRPRGSRPRRDRGRRRHDRAHADRVAGARCCRTSATRRARPTTTRSPAGSTRSRRPPGG